MSTAALPQLPDPENLRQLPSEQLVSIILDQQRVIEQQQRVIEQLTQEVNRLKLSLNIDSQTSSKPPSTDLIKKPEKALFAVTDKRGTPEAQARGTTRTYRQKSFMFWTSRPRCELYALRSVLTVEALRKAGLPVAVQVQQVAQLVERPIEVVEYQRLSCQCTNCGEVHTAPRPESIVPGQDLGVDLQA